MFPVISFSGRLNRPTKLRQNPVVRNRHLTRYKCTPKYDCRPDKYHPRLRTYY